MSSHSNPSTTSSNFKMNRSWLFIFLPIMAMVWSCHEEKLRVVGQCPEVTSTNPASNAQGVSENISITAVLRDKLNPLFITPASFTLKQEGIQVAGKLTYEGTNSTLTFIPTNPLPANAMYSAEVVAMIRDVEGHFRPCTYPWSFSTNAASGGAMGVNLKTASRFGVLAGLGIKNYSASVIHDMDVGVYPGLRSSLKGFTTGTVINGVVLASDDSSPAGIKDLLAQAQQDISDAYDKLQLATYPVPTPISGELGGMTLPPGIYKSIGSLTVSSGDLILDGQGNADAVWIFQISEDMVTIGGSGGNIILTGEAKAQNVFWQVGSTATIGEGTSFKGNILAATSIRLSSGSSVVGRLLVKNGEVSLSGSNAINKP